jgi:hypothetical protein
MTRIGATICSTLLLWCAFVIPANAYTGIYGIFPSIPGGPAHVTVSQFKLDTTSGPQFIQTSLNYMYSITISTSEPIKSHILVKEYPSDSGTAFDIIVPQKVQDALITATIQIWAPEVDDLVIEHDHKGAPLEYEDAHIVEPPQYDEDGNILWEFTVTNFSSFTPFESLADAMKPRSRWASPLWQSLFPVLSLSLVAPFLYRKRAK